jgi:hypothetical protein
LFDKLSGNVTELNPTKHYGFTPVGMIQSASTQTGFNPPEIAKLFEGWEYRFWAADLDNPQAVIVECRCCKALFSNDQDAARKKHLSELGCSKRLTAAYKLLLRDMVCVICNHKTTREKWGVPLCGSGCMEAWCTCEGQPDALKEALKMVPAVIL